MNMICCCDNFFMSADICNLAFNVNDQRNNLLVIFRENMSYYFAVKFFDIFSLINDHINGKNLIRIVSCSADMVLCFFKLFVNFFRFLTRPH